MEKKYFLFGGTVCNALIDEGIDEALSVANDDPSCFEVFEWNEDSKPEYLLQVANGWEDYMTITEDQFKLFFEV